MQKEEDIQTVVELEKWLNTHCYSLSSYSINGNIIYEGRGLENNGGLFQWFYTERGHRKVLKHFATESEAVQYALKEIKSDAHANRHLVDLYKSKAEVNTLTNKLEQLSIKYFTDEIPYGGENDYRTRVFVFDCDITKVPEILNTLKIAQNQYLRKETNTFWSKFLNYWKKD